MIKKEMGLMAEALDRATVVSIVMIGMTVSLLSLSIPIAAQTLINFIAFGKLFQPVITLSVMLFVTMMAVGALHVWQIVIVEVIQQKLMVKITLELTEQFTQLSFENDSMYHAPELVNRFFEVVTINKSLASLLLYGINLGLQLFFGLLLLLIYHPLFLIFDGFLIGAILLVIFLPYRKGLETAQEECSQKHQIAAWLDDILVNRFLFRFHSYHRYATQQADKQLVSFLKARNRQFKQLLKHQIGFYSLSALASSLLLGIGGYLVIKNQLSLGQLVAAEIVLGAIIYALRGFGALLEDYYDLKASQKKLETVLHLPVDECRYDLDELFLPITMIKLKIKGQAAVIASPTMPLFIYSHTPGACQKLRDAFFDFGEKGTLELFINDTFCSYENRVALRQHSLLIGQPQWFAGTIYDNLLLNQRQIPSKVIIEQLKKIGLLDKIMHQPDGLKTIVYEWQTIFTAVEIIQFMVVRALLVKPQLLMIDRAFDLLEQQMDEMMPYLMTLNSTTLIILSQKNDFKHMANRLVLH